MVALVDVGDLVRDEFDLSDLQAIGSYLSQYGERFRERLGASGRLRFLGEGGVSHPIVAVDSASIRENLGGGVHILVAGVGVNLSGVLGRGSKIYRFSNNQAIDAFCSLGRLAVEFDLIARLSRGKDYIILDNSLKRLPLEVNYIFYSVLREAGHGDNLFESAVDLLQEVFGDGGTCLEALERNRLIAVSKENTSQFMVREFQQFLEALGEPESGVRHLNSLNDKVLLQFILKPGEYLVPTLSAMRERRTPRRSSLFKDRGVEWVSFLPLESCFRKYSIYHTFFLPKPGAFVQRIEYGLGNNIEDVLATIRPYCHPEIPEILHQCKADRYAKAEIHCLKNEYQESLLKLVKGSDSLRGKFYKILLSKQRS